MRILVYPHAMELGGSQLNAIELAAAVRDRGHDVAVYSPDGPLVERVHGLGLPWVPAVTIGRRPSPVVARDLARLVRHRRIDVVHGYEWPPALEAYAATTLTGSAVVATVMSMAVAPFLPSSMPLVVGTRHLQQVAGRARRGPTHLIEPPVDLNANRPGPFAEAFRRQFQLSPDVPTIVVVGRLVVDLKLEGVLTAVAAVATLAARRALRLVIVGDGAARGEVERAAAAANAQAGEGTVLLTGALADPRGAYDVADVVIGMGSSALRALAFAKPLIVQGEGGFFGELSPATVDQFVEHGWYGRGVDADPVRNQQGLIALLEPLLDDEARRARLGRYGRELVEARYGLGQAAAVQEQIYQDALAARARRWPRAKDGMRAGVGLARYKVDRLRARRRGIAPVDDFNARPA